MTAIDFSSQVKQSISNLTDPALAVSDVSLTNCDREPIHIPNAIQSHGVLLTFTQTDLEILQISQNSQALLGRAPADFIGQPLSVLMPPSDLAAIRSCINADFENVNPLRLSLQIDGKSEIFEGIVHRSDGVIVLELERVSIGVDVAKKGQQGVSFFDFYKFVKAPIDRIQTT
jgi:two-component system, chemotaxis family, sensor kinase Cph1